MLAGSLLGLSSVQAPGEGERVFDPGLLGGGVEAALTLFIFLGQRRLPPLSAGGRPPLWLDVSALQRSPGPVMFEEADVYFHKEQRTL
ncbi:hypothetical protein Y1Q_0010917 [Alligator mississippiensis]|uniref:Uncharacterized protein n=1 Tax=Alligator mississippiensis TaxID=8496 RepID=A0A151MUN6_ALLMI|nr:hypothetical protein Y1Q_0010917 [Alligator mississippiensis]